MRKKNPLSVRSQIEHLTNVSKSLNRIIPDLRYKRAEYIGNSNSNSKFRWNTISVVDINRQNLIKLIIFSLRDMMYELLHKKPMLRTEDTLYEQIDLDSIILLLKGEIKGLRKSVDNKEITDTFDACYTELLSVKYFYSNVKGTQSPAPINNIELSPLDELY